MLTAEETDYTEHNTTMEASAGSSPTTASQSIEEGDREGQKNKRRPRTNEKSFTGLSRVTENMSMHIPSDGIES